MKDIDTIITATLKRSLRPPRDSGDPSDAIFDRAAIFEDPVLAYVHKEEALAEGAYESIETALFDRLDALAHNGSDRLSKAGIEAADETIAALIAAETVVPQGSWDALEERLMVRIEAAPGTRTPEKQTAKQPRYIWPVLPFLASMMRYRNVQIALVACIAGVTALSIAISTGWRTDLASTVTQASGSAYRNDLGDPMARGATLASSRGGNLIVANKAGSVALSDDASLTIAEANNHAVEYRVFTVADRRNGRIAFDVEKRVKGQRFVVVTPWYEIHVVGTRFVLEQETGGALATTITEGRVRIESPGMSDLYVDAGQTFSMDAARKAWRVEVAQSLAETEKAFMGGSTLNGKTRLTVLSTPANAEVYIGGIYKGVTPYAALRPDGAFAVSVRLEGYGTRDTIVELKDTGTTVEVTLSPLENVMAPVDSAAAANAAQKGTGGATMPMPAGEKWMDSIARAAQEHATLVARVRGQLDNARQSEAASWKTALKIYRDLAEDLSTPPLYRQTALFSLGRLEADRKKDTAAAIKDFGTYCIVYPEGLFTGEALLRLAELEIRHNPSSAIEYFQRFLTVDPRNPRRADVAYHLGLLLAQQDNFSEAIKMYSIALEQLGSKSAKRRKEIEQMIGAAQAAGSFSQGTK
jgi:TolA-binding protein